MKKLLFTAAVACMAFAATAQTETTTGTDEGMKATSGDFATEANINLFGGTVGLNNGVLNQLKGRYFLSDDMALRLGVNLQYDTKTNNFVGGGETKDKLFAFTVLPGIEKHFGGTNRLSPYVGAELALGVLSRNSKTTATGGGVTEVSGAWSTGETGYSTVGLNGLVGCDFYLAKHLFAGFELGYGLGIMTNSKVETKSAGGTVVDSEKSSNLTFGPFVRNGIRIGFVL